MLSLQDIKKFILGVLLFCGCSNTVKNNDSNVTAELNQDSAILTSLKMQTDSVFKCDFYGGEYVNTDNQLVILYKDTLPNDFKQKYQGIYVKCKYSHRQLDSVVKVITTKIPTSSISVQGYGIDEVNNCIDVTISNFADTAKFKKQVTDFEGIKFSFGIIEIIDD